MSQDDTTLLSDVSESDSSGAEHADQSFQAPFFPSVNLENTQSTHNGWAVVTPSATTTNSARSDSQNESINIKISSSLVNQRSDKVDISASNVEAIDSSTRKFDLENFQPELQGGFKPIYKTADSTAMSPEKEDSGESLIYEDDEI